MLWNAYSKQVEWLCVFIDFHVRRIDDQCRFESTWLHCHWLHCISFPYNLFAELNYALFIDIFYLFIFLNFYSELFVTKFMITICFHSSFRSQSTLRSHFYPSVSLHLIWFVLFCFSLNSFQMTASTMRFMLQK